VGSSPAAAARAVIAAIVALAIQLVAVRPVRTRGSDRVLAGAQPILRAERLRVVLTDPFAAHPGRAEPRGRSAWSRLSSTGELG
jgi:hypothetical protein